MKLRKTLGRILLLLSVLLLFAFVFVKYKTKQFIAELHHLEHPHFTLTTKNTSFDLIKRKMVLKDIVLLSHTEADSIKFTIQELRITGINYLPYLLSKKIQLDSLYIEEPNLIITEKKEIPKTAENKTKKKSRSIHINHLQIENGSITEKNVLQETKTAIGSIHTSITKVNYNSMHKTKFSADTYHILLDHLKISPSPLTALEIEKLELTKAQWKLSHVRYNPLYDKAQYSKHIPYQTDWISAHIPLITIHDPPGLQHADKTFKAKHIVLDSIDLDIFRDKLVPRKAEFKPMLATLIKEMPVKLAIDSVSLSNGTLRYGERVHEEGAYGSVFLEDITTKIYKINTITPDTINVLFSARVGRNGILKGTCNMPLDHKNDVFTVSVYMGDIKFSAFNSFTKNNLNLTNRGTISNAYITLSGNAYSARGRSLISYDDFRVTLLHKKTGNEKKLLSDIANIFVHKNSKNRPEQTFTVERNKERSFFNYMWLCMEQAMKVTMI